MIGKESSADVRLQGRAALCRTAKDHHSHVGFKCIANVTVPHELFQDTSAGMAASSVDICGVPWSFLLQYASFFHTISKLAHIETKRNSILHGDNSQNIVHPEQ